MTRIGILLGGIALAAASAGHAQLLGGGGVGGMVGGMGGGGLGGGSGNLSGRLGGAMGSVDGDVQGSLHSQQLREAAHLDRVRAREARAAAKAAQRNPALALPTSSAVARPVAPVMATAVAPPLAAGAGGVAGGMVSTQRPRQLSTASAAGRSPRAPTPRRDSAVCAGSVAA